ncbi:hypothetical protein ACGFS9_26130 [Streptomyces sp. NPDC048566]|uniref:hypothetical protein n=1 Tax=Streptomyces sp. NPDC048566 TaxID=3365569 RepID=UPI003712EBEF
MTTTAATAITRRLGRLLCGHLALAMSATAALSVLGARGQHTALLVVWAAFPLTALAWALARADEKRRQVRDRNASTADPADWTPAA